MFTPSGMRFIRLGILLCLTALLLPACSAPVAVKLAANRKPLFPIVVSEQASEKVKAHAATLAEMLQKITGATFPVKTGDGTAGLAVGIFTDFPSVKTDKPFNATDPKKREEYLLRTHSKGVYLIGATELAVQNAVWDFLHRLGYRQFFPNPHWEIIPSAPAPSLALDAWESPDYYARRIWYGFGTYPENAKMTADWMAKNRAQGSIVLNTGHSYEGYINTNKAEFAAHPEYLALITDPKTGETKRGGSKFCIANPGLRQLIVASCLKAFAANPASDSVSLDPSDGGGWCECDACVRMGSVSDRVVTLANEVAEAINAQYPGKLVGIYAYYMHSPPPTITVHPNVVISIATAFISGGFTVDQLLDGWSAKATTLGIREYYAVNTWHRDLPGGPRGSNLTYLQQTIPHFYEKGVRFMSSESGDNWGVNGLGYYFATRMMWDVEEAKQRDAIVADFLTKAFGPAKKPMAEFYRLIDGNDRQRMSEDLIGRMYRTLKAAKELTTDEKIHARIDDLILYTRYVELFSYYSATRGEEHQQAFEQLMRFVYRIHATGMVHSYAISRDVPGRDKSVTVPENCAWNVKEDKNPWKQDPPINALDLDTMLAQGIAENKLIDFTPVNFSENLVPATALKLPDVPTSMPAFTVRFNLHAYTWVPEGTGSITARYNGNGRIYSLESPKHALPTPVDEIDLRKNPPTEKDKPQQVTVKTTYSGLHTLHVHGSSAGVASVSLLDGLPMTAPAEDDFAGRWYAYFYVPKGTKVIGGYAEAKTGVLLDPAGKQAFLFEKMLRPGYFSVPVPAGMDGRLWKMNFCSGQRLLMTVPPYYARNAAELLLPAEVVEKDAPKAP